MPTQDAHTTAAGILDCFDQPALLIDEERRVRAANRSFLGLFQNGTPVVGRCCHEVVHGSGRLCEAGGHCPLIRALSTGESARAFHVHSTLGGPEHHEVSMHPLDGSEDGRLFVEVLRTSPVASVQPCRARLVGSSPAFTEMMGLVARVAPTEIHVLLHGPSGTGKELVARAIHQLGRRSRGPFVPVDCSALRATLFESELFGHEKGAFTGALAPKRGLVEAAAGGTLFLDEVGDVPLDLQVKLLRLLESGTFRHVGSTAERRADFRLVCATHRDLGAMVAHGTFRQDLYFRISAFPIRLPALRERREDIPLLVDSGLQRLGDKGAHRFSGEAMEALAGYDFPGNVRELLNIVERGRILADGGTIRPEHICDLLRLAVAPPPAGTAEAGVENRGDGRLAAGRLRRGRARPRPVCLDRLAVGAEPPRIGSLLHAVA
jgi:transcriptional regulator with PAS, ATPase and Fis domain